ncbi:MAG TPA: hypothetical protein VJT09_05190 [Pyrinomonadaceae bacterium]|nr:hypothetical protein [Pyrinomonadaceae bacterium]
MMNRKFHFTLLAFALTVAATFAFVSGRGTATRAASTGAALSALPASDFVISIDAQRALNEAVPGLFASNPALLAKMNAEIEKFEKETGISPRSFSSIAIGGRMTSGRYAQDRSVVIVNGTFNSDELIETAFATAKARGENFQREEQVYEGKRIFLISSSPKTGGEAGKQAASAGINIDPALYRNLPYDRFGDPRSQSTATPKQPAGGGVGFGPTKDSKTPPLAVLEGQGSGKGSGRDSRMAVVTLDANTLALGDLAGVRAAVDASLGREHVDDELVRLATQQPGAIVSFSGKLPANVSDKPQRSNGTIEKYMASIRQFYGSLGMIGTDAEAAVAVRTETAEQASDIGQALNAIKSLSAFGFSQSTGTDSARNNSLADLLKGLTITTQGNEVQINVRIPQASVAPLVRHF